MTKKQIDQFELLKVLYARLGQCVNEIEEIKNLHGDNVLEKIDNTLSLTGFVIGVHKLNLEELFK